MSQWPGIQREARLSRGLSVSELALRTGLPRPNLSAYEHGRMSPTVDTAGRIAQALGKSPELADTAPTFTVHFTQRGKPFRVPSTLPRLPLHRALRKAKLPLNVFWSGDRGRQWNLADHNERIFAYEHVLTEGREQDILDFIHADFLIDAWGSMMLPAAIQAAWQPVIDAAMET